MVKSETKEQLKEKIKVLQNYCKVLKRKDDINNETKKRNQILINKLKDENKRLNKIIKRLKDEKENIL